MREFPLSADLTLRCRPPVPAENEEELEGVDEDGDDNDEDEALRWAGGGGALVEGVALKMSRESAAPQRIRPMAANFHNFILEWGEALSPCRTNIQKQYLNSCLMRVHDP